MHGRFCWTLGFVVIAFSISCTECRPEDATNCTVPTEYHTDGGNESIPVGCPQGKWYMTPLDPFQLNVTYTLYKQPNQSDPTMYSWNHSFTAETGKDKSLESEDQSTQNKTLLVLVHGFTQSGQTPWLHNMMKAYFAWAGPEKVDVLIVDWKNGSSAGESKGVTNYIKAARNVQMVGRLTANFIARFANSHKIGEKFIHLFGQSMGAQTVGEVSFWLRSKYNITVGRVTATDPADMLFGSNDNLLDKNDTSFLEVVHVSARPWSIGVIFGQVGLYEAIGHIDLYPNGGKVFQPGCTIFSGFLCSHRRGLAYYQGMLEANKTCDFEGTLCANESDAYSKNCNNGTIEKVWSHMNSQAAKAISGEETSEQENKKSEIIFFATDNEKLNLKCESKNNTAE